MFREFTFNLEKARQRLSKCEKIKLIEGSMIEGSGIYDFDRSKLLFSTVGTSVNGRLLHQILRDRYHIEMEMAAEKYVLGIAAVGDTEEGFERLCTAIEEIDAEIQQTDESEESQYHTSHARMTQLMTISQAVDAQQRRYSLKESVGKVSAEFAYLYPPGIPIIVPGEQITGQFVRNVRRYMEQGLEVQGLSDTSAETICVAARNEIGQGKNTVRQRNNITDMGKIFYIMGKSASGKDRIYSLLAAHKELNLKTLILYTTRPIRVGEQDGKNYYFVDDGKLEEFRKNGNLIEERAYHTVYGI